MTQAIQPRISVSLVLYQADLEMVMQVVHRLVDAYCYAGFFSGLHIYLIDNGGSSSVLSYFQREYISWKSFMTFDWISGHGNIGYGAAHNLAIRRADSDFHLILNPDVLIDKATFVEACRFFNNHPEAGLIAPYVSDGNGKMQYLCKRYPSLWVLFLRGFTPEWIQRRCKKRLEAYIMKDVINADQIFWDPPIVSGCFMLFRTDVLKSLGGFDPNFFFILKTLI